MAGQRVQQLRITSLSVSEDECHCARSWCTWLKGNGGRHYDWFMTCVPPQNTLITLDMDTDMTYKHLCVRPSAIDHLIFNQKCINVWQLNRHQIREKCEKRSTLFICQQQSQAAPQLNGGDYVMQFRAKDFNSCLCHLPLLCWCSYCLWKLVWKDVTVKVSLPDQDFSECSPRKH